MQYDGGRPTSRARPFQWNAWYKGPYLKWMGTGLERLSFVLLPCVRISVKRGLLNTC